MPWEYPGAVDVSGSISVKGIHEGGILGADLSSNDALFLTEMAVFSAMFLGSSMMVLFHGGNRSPWPWDAGFLLSCLQRCGGCCARRRVAQWLCRPAGGCLSIRVPRIREPGS